MIVSNGSSTSEEFNGFNGKKEKKKRSTERRRKRRRTTEENRVRQLPVSGDSTRSHSLLYAPLM